MSYGVPRRRARWAHVNGYLFYGEQEPSYPGDPELNARAIRERWWVREYEHWFADEKPAIEATNRRLQAVDVGALDDASLHAHVREALEHVLTVAPLHFSHRGRELSRQELRRLAEAEGVELGDLGAFFAGRSPASSRPAHLVAAIADALRDGGVDPGSIHDLALVRAVPEAARLLDEYLDEFGQRLLDSYDLACPTLGERPEVVCASIRAAASPTRRREPMTASLPAMSDELRRLVEEAAISAGTEDDDDGVCIFWPSGLLRRALLEVARRRGLRDPAAVFEVDRDELYALLDGRGPSVEELHRRLEARLAAAAITPPPSLGTDDTDQRASDADRPRRALEGTGIGTDVRGRACVVGVDGDGLAHIEPDDVLVAVTTTPGYNAVMPIVAAIATETNMGHTVICARELGIPAVVGVPGLLSVVQSGDLVEVDAANGVVRVIAPA